MKITLLDNKLNFNVHYLAAIDKASRMLGFITRNVSDFKDPVYMKTIFSLVGCLLELFGSID